MTPRLEGLSPEEDEEYGYALLEASIGLRAYVRVRSPDLMAVLHAAIKAVHRVPPADVIAALRALTEDRP